MFVKINFYSFFKINIYLMINNINFIDILYKYLFKIFKSLYFIYNDLREGFL
jgi:hypothetical protein